MFSHSRRRRRVDDVAVGVDERRRGAGGRVLANVHVLDGGGACDLLQTLARLGQVLNLEEEGENNVNLKRRMRHNP